MIWTIYIVILSYFALGFIGFYFINRKKSPVDARKSWLKYITYFFIIHILFFSIAFRMEVFRVLSAIIIVTGLFELFRLFVRTGFQKKGFFLLSVIVFSVLATGFYLFSNLKSGLVLFTFLILSIFDSFSQIAGQLWGRTKLLQKISPQKTVEGLMGGVAAGLLSSLLLAGLIEDTIYNPVGLAGGIILFAFVGDISASYYKRKYNVKDFSNLIPGHGGFLDRFDSLIAGGAFVAWSNLAAGLYN